MCSGLERRKNIETKAHNLLSLVLLSLGLPFLHVLYKEFLSEEQGVYSATVSLRLSRVTSIKSLS